MDLKVSSASGKSKPWGLGVKVCCCVSGTEAGEQSKG